jgi:NAD(P)-dependent dehydrogenase (short-subunit alcohol dehydrogenase family)
MFRDELLSSRRVAIAGGLSAGAVAELGRLGAWIEPMPDLGTADEQELVGWVAERLPLSALVFDAGASFGSGGEQHLQAALEHAWSGARAVATAALIPAKESGRVLFVAPRPDAGPLAGAARAALENLARTLSVEWARFTVTAVAIWPGASSTDEQLAALLGFLLSEAGGYFSGCRFELGAADVETTFIPAS